LTLQPPRRRWRIADLYLVFAGLVALAPGLLLALGAGAAATGLSDWRSGLGLFVVGWAPRLAVLGVATGAAALVVALLGGFRRYWRPALAILAITTLTLGAYLWHVGVGSGAAQGGV